MRIESSAIGRLLNVNIPSRFMREEAITRNIMKKNYLLGIDVGTTGAKALLFSDCGEMIASAYRGYPLITPGIGTSEQRATDWTDAVVEIVREVCANPECAENVRGISLSTQGGTIVPVDENFQPLANAIVWSDARCAGDKSEFDECLGEGYIYKTCGWNLNRGLPAMQLRRMRAERPEIFEKARYFLSVPDFVSAFLTGKPAIDLSNAGINHLCDIKNGKYDPKILKFIGVREDQLAELVPSCHPIGTLTKEAAAKLGLNESVVVSSGAHDQYAVALGAGICAAGDAVIGTGTAWVVTALRDEPDFESGFAQSISATDGKWGAMLSISTGGVCLDWLRKKVLSEKDGTPLDYDTLNALAAERDEPGAGGLKFYPYFNGAGAPESDNACKGTLIGLDLSHDKGHIVRAVMEGVACQIVWALRAMEKRQPMKRLFLAGGATKSAVWTNMIAEIAGKEIHVSEIADLACAGAAMMAGVGCGLFENTEFAAKAIAPGGRAVIPNPVRAEKYKKVFEEYQRGARALRKWYKEV